MSFRFFDEEGRFNPKFDENNRFFYEGDMIVESIGQGMDISYIPDPLMEQLEKGARGRLKVNEDFSTSLPWLFAGGDIIQGPDVIHGIANGHTAAKGIDTYLKNRK
jgi:glutamate synthase (NADPH/NADH) small chain